jgi:type II secretory pathway pseudopilin PulG
MIKLFRKIRYELMEKNKTGKYLKYAIGEIVLVVIGILIALSINNWNDNRNKRNEELLLLESIEQDFNENKQRLNQTIKAQEKMIFNSNSFITLMANNKGKEVNQDSILKLKSYANSWYRAELVNSSYLTIVNSGKGNYIQNLNLKKRLAEFSTDLESGFEDDYESKESLNFMYKISYGHESMFLSKAKKKELGIDIPKDSIRKSIDLLISNKFYLGALINKTGIESARLAYQKKLLAQTDEILNEIKSDRK